MINRARLLVISSAILLASCQNSTGSAPTVSIDIAPETTSVKEHELPINRPKKHIVATGETLIEIALKYGLDYREIARWNFLTNPDLIEVGQQLSLVAPKFEPKANPVAQASKANAVPQLETINSEEAEKLANLSPADRTTAPSVRRRQKLIGGGQNNSPTAKLVSNPRAVKLPYSEEAILRLQGRETTQATPASLRTTGTGPTKTQTKAQIVWSWPVSGSVTGEYTADTRGIDINGKRGETIHSSASGKVIYVGSGLKGYGQIVIVRHKNEYVSVYAHNDKIFVAEGDQVERGQPIAAMGDTGAKQIGLHFQIRRGSKWFDPRKYLPKVPN